MTVDEAIRSAPTGVLLDVELVPGAAEDRFPSGYNAWRKRLQARVSAPPVEGRANEALLVLVAGFFEVPGARVRLVAGAQSRQKRVLVEGPTVSRAAAKLEAALARAA